MPPPELKPHMNPTNSELEINSAAIRYAASIYRALNNRTRLTMLRLIHQWGSLTVTELFNKMNMDQSATSQHLAILRKAGFVQTERNKKFVVYRIDYASLDELAAITGKLLN